jgi:hypothetical protein
MTLTVIPSYLLKSNIIDVLLMQAVCCYEISGARQVPLFGIIDALTEENS